MTRTTVEQREYRAKNLEQLRAYQRNYYRRRYQSDPANATARRSQSLKWKESESGKQWLAEYRKTGSFKRTQLNNVLKRQFGISIEDYLALLDRQNGCCGLCRRPPKTGRRLAVDHDHETKRVRGLLCDNCNLWLGQIERYLRAPTLVDRWIRRTVKPQRNAGAQLRLTLE